MNGIVLWRNVEPGQTVAASFQTPTLYTLADDLTRMGLHADIDEADIGQVREGQEARFTVDAYPGHTFPARIVAIRNAPQTIEKIVVIAFTFSGIVSMIFGFFPARRAARLDPIEALRYE